ncbi:Short chain dehydrogenase [Modestobacter italicus]|uniref:Short chain dehydrogenase n=1 Tax=Modestobacter italicus (strain DSM 44449 / CECT 9708 / BC 501) TaxID=2732864 RepID=I4EVP6_MODI5|nr:SDR family oxidoreductase [Modestobacter marinus]CCH87459.1 Short chain dehydrogenase [Modestobacter marinus]
MSTPSTTAVQVVIGAGSIGQAIARRTGAGKHLLLADFSETNLQDARTALEDAGHTVTTQRVDVSDAASVRALAQAAAGLGDVVQVISTAGVSPVQAPAEAVLAVDLYGTAVVLEEFGKVIAPGGASVHISSMAGHMPAPLDPETAHALAFTPVEELLALPALAPDAVPNSGAAYAIAKQANHLRVQAAAVTWGDRGARVNCLSPGIILTPLARDEMSGPGAEGYREMIEVSAAGRVGTADEVATAAAFLLGPDAGFITGTDLLIDGGVIAALRAGRWQFGA